MFIRNKINIKHYNFIFVVLAFLFSVFLFGICGTANVNAATIKYQNTELSWANPIDGYISGSDVSLRRGAGTNYSVIVCMSKNTKFTLISNVVSGGNNWRKIRLTDGTVGYVSASWSIVETAKPETDEYGNFVYGYKNGHSHGKLALKYEVGNKYAVCKGFYNSDTKEKYKPDANCLTWGLKVGFPSKVDGKPVVIDEKAFYGIENVYEFDLSNVSNLYVEDTTFGVSSFANCGMRVLKLSTSTKRIPKNCFSDTNIDYINIPCSVQIIDKGAFHSNGAYAINIGYDSNGSTYSQLSNIDFGTSSGGGTAENPLWGYRLERITVNNSLNGLVDTNKDKTGFMDGSNNNKKKNGWTGKYRIYKNVLYETDNTGRLNKLVLYPTYNFKCKISASNGAYRFSADGSLYGYSKGNNSILGTVDTGKMKAGVLKNNTEIHIIDTARDEYNKNNHKDAGITQVEKANVYWVSYWYNPGDTTKESEKIFNHVHIKRTNIKNGTDNLPTNSNFVQGKNVTFPSFKVYGNIKEICDEAFRQAAFLSSVKIPTTINRIGEFAFYYSSNSMLARKYFLKEIIFYDPGDNDKTISGSALVNKLLKKVGRDELKLSGSNGMAMDKISNGGLSGTGKTNSFFSSVLSKVAEGYYAKKFNFDLEPVKNAYAFDDFITLVEKNYHNSDIENYGKDVKQSTSADLNRYLGLYKWSAWTNAEQTEAITEIDTSFLTEDKPRKYFIVYDNSGSMGAYPGDNEPFTKNLITHALIKHLSDEILSANSENKLGITAAWREYDPEIDNSIYKADKDLNIGSKDNPYLYAWRKIAKTKDGNDDGFISATSAGSDDNAKAAVSEYLNHIAGEKFGDTNYYTPLRDVAKLIKSKGAGEAAPVVIFIADGATTNFGCFSSNVKSYVEDETKITKWKKGSTTSNDWFDGATPSVEGHAWTRFSESSVEGSFTHAQDELQHLRDDYFVAKGIQARSIVVGTRDSNNTLKDFVGGDANYCAEIANMGDFVKKINSIVSTTSGTVVLRDVIGNDFKIQTKIINDEIVPDIEFLIGGTNTSYGGVAAPGAPSQLKMNSDFDKEGNGWKLVSVGNSNYMNDVRFDSKNYTNKTLEEIKDDISLKNKDETEDEIQSKIINEIKQIEGIHIPYLYGTNANRINRIRIKTTLRDNTKTGVSIATNSQYHDSGVIGGAKDTSLTFADGASNEDTENYVASPTLKRYGVTINKKDTDGKVVADAQFNIKDSSDNILKFKEIEKDDGSWYYVYTDEKSKSVEGYPVTNTLVTDGKGQINVYALPVATPDAPNQTSATFSIVETWAPTGYSKAAPKTITVGGGNAVASQTVDIVDEIATRSIFLGKCFEVGNLTSSEVLEKAKLLNFKIEGTKVNNSTFTSATYNVVDDEFSYTFSYTNNYSHKYVLFYKPIKVPAGNYTVTEEIADNSFFDNKAVYVTNQSISYIDDSIIAELLRGNKENSISVDLSSSNKYVTFLNNLKTVELDINKTTNSVNNDYFNGYYFEVEGINLLKEKFVWRVYANGSVKKYSVDSSGKETEILNQPNAIVLQGTLDGNITVEDYYLGSMPYSPDGYTVKEVIASDNNNFDKTKTKTYSSLEDFISDSNGKTSLETPVYEFYDGFLCAYFRNIPVGSITVEKTSEDGVVEGLTFILREEANTSVSYTAVTDASGIAAFDNLPVFDVNGKKIEYEIVEDTTTTRRYGSATYKKSGLVLSEKSSKYHSVGTLEVGDTIEISVHNILKKGTINIKKYYNGDQNESESSNYANIPFILYQYDYYGNKIGEIKPGSKDIETGDDGNVSIEVPIYDTNNRLYKYQVLENPNTAKKYSSVAYSLSKVSNSGASTIFTIPVSTKRTVYVNNIMNSTLVIEKKDANSGNLLAGAEFKICRKGSTTALSFNYDSENASYNYDSNGTSAVVTSSASAPILVCGLAEGEYEITETKAPNNYEITEKAPKPVEIKKNEKNNVVGASVTFYDKLKTQKVKIFKFADNCFTASTSGSMASCPNLLGTKFKISGTLLNGLDYENILTVDSNWKHRAVFIDHNYQRKVYGYYIELDLPYSDEYTIEEIEANSIYDLSKTTSRLISLVVPDNNDATWTKDDFFLQESSQSMTIAVNKNTIDNATCIFYNRVKHLPINIYKSVAAESLEDALAIVDGTKFRTYGGINHNTPTITTSVNGIIELNTANGWTQVDNKIAGLGSSVYCFKYTIDNVAVGTETTIREFPGKNCDNTLVSASKLPNASSAEKLYDSSSSMLKTFTLGDVKIGTNRNAYFFNYPKRAPLIITKSANMFTAPDNLPVEITKEIMLDSLNGIEFRISGTTYWGKEINLDIPIDNSWKVASNPNSKCYYMYTSVSDNLGKDLPLGNYTIKEVLPTNSEFVASKTMSKLYDVDPSKNPEALYENVKNDYTVSSNISCNTSTGTKTASFYNIKDYVKLTLKKYLNVWSDFDGLGPKACLIKLLDGTRFLISGKTEAGQEYSKEVVINEENKDLFEATYEGRWCLYYTMNIPRGNYTIEEVESPNYDLSKTTSKFENLNNHASYTSSASLQINLLNITNQNSSNFVCAFHNKAATTDLTIYKILDYNGFDYSTPLTPEEKQGIKDLFKDLKFTISCETFYGTDIKTLETNNQDDWKVDCYQGRPYIYQTVSVPIGTCTITETAADGTNTHNYFDLSKTSVAKNMSGAFSANSYSNSITETYTKDSKSSRIYFANRLKTKQIKVALFGEGANSITAAKELLDNTQFEIKANSTISGVPYGASKITFNKNNLSDTLIADTDNIKLEIYTDNNSSTYAGFAYAEITVPEGNYSVTELSSNSVYDLSKTSYSWNAQNAISGSNVGTTYTKNVSSAANATAETFNFYFYNRYALGEIVVNKIDSETEAPIKGVEFELRDKNYKVLKFKEDTKSTADKPVYVLDETSGSSTLKTGNEGNFTVKDMPYGSYYLFETKSTEDYVTDENSAFISLTSPTVTKTIENTLKQETLRIVKAAEDIDEDTDDVNAVLKDLSFTIQGTKKNGAEYEKNITIDGNISLTKSSINNSSYVFFDVTVPVGQYTVSEDTSNVEKYASDRVCVADSVEKIIDENSRTLGNSIDVTVNAINTNTEEDSNNSEVAATACFYNPLNYVKLQLCKYVPNVVNTDNLKSLLSGTKFIIESKNSSSYYQEYTIDKDNFIWVPVSSSTIDNVLYKGYKLASTIVLPAGTYDVSEVPNDSFDASKTKVGYSLSHALANAPRTSFEITMTKTDTTYNRTFVNYPTTKTVRLAKVANNTFDSITDKQVYTYLNGIEFKFEDAIFGDNGYNETIAIDSSWTIGKSNGYKYLYKDIEVPVSSYTVTETFGSNVYYDTELSETHYANTLANVLDVSKRESGRSATLNVTEGVEELYFFNTAKPTKLVLSKAVEENISYASLFKLVAGTKFILTNETTGSVTTVVVPDKASSEPDELGGKWGAWRSTVSDKTYTRLQYVIYGLDPGNYEIKEIPNENFAPSGIYTSDSLSNAVKNKTNNNPSDTYSFAMSKPFVDSDATTSYVTFLNTLDTKTIRVSKVANNTFANLQDSTILNYLNGLQFDINNTLISGEGFSKTVTIDNTWSVATSGHYKYAYKDIEVPAGIYTVEESIGSNTTFNAELAETYYQTSVENVLDETKRQQGTLGAVTTSDSSNEICFFNTAGSVKLIIYKAVQGSLSKAAMVDLVKGTKFEIRNNITNDLTTVTVGEDACVTADEYGRKWGYSTKTGSDGNVYTLLQYVIEGFDPGQYNIKEIPNDNFVQSEIRVNTSLAVTIGSQPKDNINFTAHKPNTMSNATYSNLFLNTLETKTMRIVKLADNIYDTTTDANVRAYLNGLQFTITDSYFKDDGYSDTLTIDNTWSIAKDANNKVKYVYKDVEVPVSSYSIEETAGTNTMYDLTKTYNQRTLSDVLDTAKRTLGTKTTVNLANNEKDVYFYNSAKPGKFVLSKLVKGVKDETELRRLVNGTKFVLTNDRTAESVTYTIDSSWLFRTRSSSTGIVYGELYKTLDLDANKYTLKEVVNGNFEQDKIRIDWSVDKAEASEYRDTTTFTIVDPTKTLARYFINTPKTATIKLAKLADVTSSKISDDAVYKVLNGLDINVKSLNFNETYTIDNTWSIASGNGYKYLYKEITVPYGTYTITETAGTNTNFDMSNVYNSEALEKVINTNQRNAGSSFKLIVDSASEKAYIFNTAKLATTRLVKIMDETTSAYIHKVADGTKFIVTGTDFVGRSVNKTFTVDSNWKYNTATYDSQKYSYLYLDIKLLPGSYTIAETTNANCDSSKVTTGAGLQAAIKSTTPGTTIKLTATSTDALYWRVFYNHLKETTLYLSKIGENINSKASYSETHKFLDGLQFKVSGNTALGEVYDKTFTINSDWYISTAGNYRKLTYNLSLPYGSYTFTELSGSNNKYDLNKTKFAYNSTDILNEAVRKTGTSTSITISNTTSYGLVFLNVLKEKPEYSISDTTASTPDSSLTGTIETHVVNGAEESYNDGTDIPVVVIIKDKDGNEKIIATEEVDLKAGEEKDLTFSVIYPNDIKPEEYEIEVRINWDDKDKEQDPTNNTDSTVINPYDFAINKVGLKENEASVGGYIKLVPEITYSGSKPFTDNNATLQFYVIDSSGNQVGDILSEIKLNSIKDLVDSDGNLNVPPNSTWTIGSDATPLSFLLPDDLVAGQTYQIRARVNWNNRFKELNPNNNEKEEGFSAVTRIDVKIEPNYPNSSYYAGTEVISTFTVDNLANNFDIIPKYLNVKFSVTALLPDGTIKEVPVDGDKLSIKKENVVPKKSTGIVYFKWKIPEKLSDGTSLIGATLNCKALLVANGYKDADPSNDTAVLSKKLYELPESSVADTNYEENSQAAMDALKADHSAEGIKITNFVNKAISAMEHFDKVTTNKTEDSTTFQYKNLSSWQEWNYKGGKFAMNSYYAKLNDSVNIKADENYMVDGSSDDLTKFKSGYGFTVNAKANATKASARSLPENSYTNAQYSACFFPEYLFSDKKNEYETLIYNTTKKAFEIVNEKYSNGLHYTPIWYPDITTNTGNYPVAVEFTQCWTPAGVISSKKTNNLIKISGNIYEDWYQQQH